MDEPILNAEQQDKLKKLKDPYEAEEEAKYDFDKGVQQDILSLMLHERSFMIQAINLIKDYYFVDRAHVLICKILMDWFENHVKSVVSDKEAWIQEKYIRDQLQERLRDNPTKSYYLAEFQTVLDSYIQGLTSRSYCMERIVNFARDQEIRLAVSKTVDIVKSRDKEKYDKIKTVWDKALLVGPQMDLGLNYFENIDERYKRMEEDRSGKDRFSSGFEVIDSKIVGGGLSRGEIGGYQANSGVGKSWMLCRAAIENLRKGHRVLHLTLEMNQDKTAERFDTLLSGINMNRLLENRDVVKRHLSAELKLINNLFKNEDKTRLFVKHFNAGTADINVIKAYYSQLILHGFKSDLVLVDYIGELKDFPGMKTYESRQRLMRDLRAFGYDENHCTLTAIQSNRTGRTNQEEMAVNDDSEISDSYGQARIMDAIWSINQSKIEKKAGVGRIFVIKTRNGESRFMCYYYQDKYTLAIKSISEDEWKDRVSSVKQLRDDESVVGNLIIPDATQQGFVPNG